MRTIEQYRLKALECDEIADETPHPELKRCYRGLRSPTELWKARERAIGDGSAEPHMLPQ